MVSGLLVLLSKMNLHTKNTKETINEITKIIKKEEKERIILFFKTICN